MGAYNYEHFDAEAMRGAEFDNFRHQLSVGDPAPDGVLIDAASTAEIKLSSLWRTRHVVIEFGSMT